MKTRYVFTFVAIHLALLATAARAESRTVNGTVETSHATWDGDVIVTHADVVDDSGVRTHVVQLGGAVDGVGMVFSHVPRAFTAGERVTIDVSSTGAVERVRSRSATRVIAAGAPMAGTATYGLQRTTGGRTLWRSSGCIDLAYDQASVDAGTAKVLDLAFGAWNAAVEKAGCGGLSISRHMAGGTTAEADGLSTVRVRRNKWCRPATLTSPELCYPPEAAAVTRLVFTDSPGAPDDGQILEADMELNAVNFDLVLPDATAPLGSSKTPLYLRAVATHEAGHLVGLGHDCGTGAEPWPADESGMGVPACDSAGNDTVTATMFFAVGQLDDAASTLEASDVAGACAIAKTQACEEDVVGGCSVANVDLGGARQGSSGGAAVLLVGAGVLCILVRKRRRA